MKLHRGFVITLWLLLILVCGVIADHTKYSADLSAFLPSHPTATQQLFVDQLQNGVASRLILVGIEGSDTKILAHISKQMAQQLRASAAFVSVSNGESSDNKRDRDFIFSHRYQLSPTVTSARFSTEGLRAAIEESIDLLASPAGVMIKPLLTSDPTGETLQLLKNFSNNSQPRRIDGVWISRRGDRAILLAQTVAAGADTNGQQNAITLIQQSFNKSEGAATATLVMTGPGVFSVNSRNTIKQEVTRLSIITTVIIITLLFLVYRSFTALLLGVLPVATGILIGIAAVSLGFGMVHGVTLGFGITLIGEAIDYSIYLFIQSEQSDGQEREQDWMAEFWPTIRLGVMTSIIGFASLLFSGFPGLAQLGLYSTAGLIAAAIVTRFVLPAIIPRSFHIRDVSRFGHVLNQITRHAIPLRWITVVLILVAMTILYSHRDNLWNKDLSALSPISTADRALDANLRNDLGAPDPSYIITVSGDSMDSAITASEKIATKLDPLVEDGTITGYDSPSHYLPSIATQNRRIAAIPDPDELAKRLYAAMTGLPLRAERLSDFLHDTDIARRSIPIQRTDLTDTSMALAVDALLIDHGDHWSALLPLRVPNSGTTTAKIDPLRIRAAVTETSQSDAVFIDVKQELDQMYAGYLTEALYLSLAGLAAILALLLFVLRSPSRMLRIVLPLVLAVVVVTAGLLLSGHRLTILHLVGLLLTVAIGSNYALFFDKKSHNSADTGYIRTLASLLFANLTTVTVFGLLAFSSVPVLQNIGMTVAPGVVLALLFSAILTERQQSNPDLINVT